jgi:hypothetical protein
MYIVTAALTLAVGALSSNLGARFGVRRALILTELFSAFGAAAFCFLPPTRLVLTGLYAFSAVSGALLVPQLWATVAALFNAGQNPVPKPNVAAYRVALEPSAASAS